MRFELRWSVAAQVRTFRKLGVEKVGRLGHRGAAEGDRSMFLAGVFGAGIGRFAENWTGPRPSLAVCHCLRWNRLFMREGLTTIASSAEVPLDAASGFRRRGLCLILRDGQPFGAQTLLGVVVSSVGMDGPFTRQAVAHGPQPNTPSLVKRKQGHPRHTDRSRTHSRKQGRAGTKSTGNTHPR